MTNYINKITNPDLERFIIYQITVNNTLLDTISTFKSEYIHNSEYREVFKFILNKIEQGINTTPLSIKEYYFETCHPIIAQEKYDMFIKNTNCIMIDSTKSYAKRIKSLYSQREIMKLCDKTKQLILENSNRDVKVMATQLIAKINEVTEILNDEADIPDNAPLDEIDNE